MVPEPATPEPDVRPDRSEPTTQPQVELWHFYQKPCFTQTLKDFETNLIVETTVWILIKTFNLNMELWTLF